MQLPNSNLQTVHAATKQQLADCTCSFVWWLHTEYCQHTGNSNMGLADCACSFVWWLHTEYCQHTEYSRLYMLLPNDFRVLLTFIDFVIQRRADKSLARSELKQARKHVMDARDFNNTVTRDVIKFFPLQGKAPNKFDAILTETITCFLPGRAKDFSAPLCNDDPLLLLRLILRIAII